MAHSAALKSDQKKVCARKRSSGRKKSNLPRVSVAHMAQWVETNCLFPFPKREDKERLAMGAGITEEQVVNWFANLRKRKWWPLFRRHAQNVERKQHTELDMCGKRALRKGQWLEEEKQYCNAIINAFNAGHIIDVRPGDTLRKHIARKLNCDPMRISKKYKGVNSIGKTPYQNMVLTDLNGEAARKTNEELQKLKEAFERSCSMYQDGPISSLTRLEESDSEVSMLEEKSSLLDPSHFAASRDNQGEEINHTQVEQIRNFQREFLKEIQKLKDRAGPSADSVTDLPQPFQLTEEVLSDSKVDFSFADLPDFDIQQANFFLQLAEDPMASEYSVLTKSMNSFSPLDFENIFAEGKEAGVF